MQLDVPQVGPARSESGMHPHSLDREDGDKIHGPWLGLYIFTYFVAACRFIQRLRYAPRHKKM